MNKVNRSKGNMYDWVTHTWSPIIGCPHQCSYCYVKTYQEQPVDARMELPFPKLGTGRTIFVGHLCDMFAKEVDPAMIRQVLDHCKQFDNLYVFQTKNTWGYHDFESNFPQRYILGTTIETNDEALINSISEAPSPRDRSDGLRSFTALSLDPPEQTFITVEPILKFDLHEFAEIISFGNPTFVNIGADSKNHNLPEPTKEEVLALVDALASEGVEIRKKLNLDRLM